MLTSKSDIISWLTLHGITDYQLRADPVYHWVIDADNFCVRHKGLKEVPVKLGHIQYCCLMECNALTSMDWAPESVANFDVRGNELTSLVGAPSIITESFICSDNLITSLTGCPETVGFALDCSDNPLESFEGGPKYVGSGVRASNMRLSNIKDFPIILNPREHSINLSGNPGLADLQHITDYQTLKATLDQRLLRSHIKPPKKSSSVCKL